MVCFYVDFFFNWVFLVLIRLSRLNYEWVKVCVLFFCSWLVSVMILMLVSVKLVSRGLVLL